MQNLVGSGGFEPENCQWQFELAPYDFHCMLSIFTG